MYPLSITNDNENYIIFCFANLLDTNKCILLTTTTINQHEHFITSRASTITNSPLNEESIETTTTINEQIKSNNKYEYLIEFSNFKQTPKQAYLYQLTKTKMILLVNTSECIHSYCIEYDQITLTSKISFYHSIYQSINNDIYIDSIHSIILDDEDLLNNDEQSIISDEEENLELDDNEDDSRKKDQYVNKIPKRKCFLIGLKTGLLILYDVYRTESSENNIGILADQQITGNIDKCVHVRGTETIYAWTTDNGVKKVCIDNRRYTALLYISITLCGISG
jgi:hypothetical protein